MPAAAGVPVISFFAAARSASRASRAFSTSATVVALPSISEGLARDLDDTATEALTGSTGGDQCFNAYNLARARLEGDLLAQVVILHGVGGFDDVAEVPRREPEVMGGDGIAGIAREDLLVAAPRLLDLALLVQAHGVLQLRHHVGRLVPIEAAVALLVARAAAAGAGIVAPDLRVHAGLKSRTRRSSSRSSSRDAPLP